MLSERLDAWLRRHQLIVDGAAALALALVSVLPFMRARPWIALLSAVLVLPVAVRRRYPVPAAAIVLVAAFGQWLALRGSLFQLLPADVAVPTVIYSVTAYGPRWAARLGVAAGLLGAVLGGQALPSTGPQSTSDHVGIGVILAIIVLAAWAFGRLRAVRRDQLETLRDRAALLEVERDQRARLAVSAERARIAREMHDVVAHSLAVMIAQADGGRYSTTSSPEAVTVLTTIGDTGRQALGEMRRLLAVLREDVVPAGPGDPALAPQPGIGDVATLVQRVRDGGLPVALAQDDDRLPVEPGIGLVVYRIVQEGLTNVIKHAGPGASATVSVRRIGPALEVDVMDDGWGVGAPPPAEGQGHGLLGMRERAGAYGGTVLAGPVAGGGYAVRARIPVAT